MLRYSDLQKYWRSGEPSHGKEEAMRFSIVHETSRRIRVRLLGAPLDAGEADALLVLLKRSGEICDAKVYRATSSVAFTHRGCRSSALKVLENLSRRELQPVKHEIEEAAASMEVRQLGKKRLKARIVAEACADLFLPTPIQAAYHAYQLLMVHRL